MNRYRVTEDARNDLNEIWLYIAEDNEIAANRFIRALIALFPMLASRPEMGPERRAALRSRGCCMARGICLHCLSNKRAVEK